MEAIGGLICFLIFASWVFSQISDICLLEEEQESFKEALKAVDSSIASKEPEWLALTPIQYTSLFLDRYLGKELISKRSFKSLSVMAIILLVSSIWFGVIRGTEGNFIQKPPWELYETSMKMLKALGGRSPESHKLLLENTNPEKKEKFLKTFEKFKNREALFASFNGKGWVIAYSISFLIFCVILVSILSSLSFAISRQILREMVFARGFLTLLGAISLNILLFFVLGSAFLLVLFIASLPFVWPDIGVYLVTLFSSKVWFSLLFIGGSVLSWFVSPDWIKLVVLVPVVPCILLFLLLCFCSFLYYFRELFHSTVLRLIRRALEWKAGPIGFLVAFFSLLTTIIHLIDQYIF